MAQVVTGTHEEFVPRAMIDDYVAAATRVGDSVRVILIPGAGHFEIASAATWPRVEAAILALLDGRLPPD